MAKAWQWDARRTDDEIRKILKHPDASNFLHYAAMLLARNNDPKEVFDYLTKEHFCLEWPDIKRLMRKDKLNLGRIQFWQQIYNHVKTELKAKGLVLRRPKHQIARNTLQARIGARIREIRRQKKLSQADFADQSGLTQQFVSRIEQGIENVSLDTIERIQNFLNEELVLVK